MVQQMQASIISVNRVHLEACKELTSFYGLMFVLYFFLLKIIFFLSEGSQRKNALVSSLRETKSQNSL